jgi:hypothetical protein
MDRGGNLMKWELKLTTSVPTLLPAPDGIDLGDVWLHLLMGESVMASCCIHLFRN